MDQLIAAGQVLRQEDPQDRRAKILRLTAAGRQTAERMVPFRRTLFYDIVQCFAHC